MQRNLESKFATHGTQPLVLRKGRWLKNNIQKSSGVSPHHHQNFFFLKTEICCCLAFWMGSWLAELLFHVLLLLSKRPNIICKHYALKKIMLKLPETQNITLTTSFTNALWRQSYKIFEALFDSKALSICRQPSDKPWHLMLQTLGFW